MSMANREVSDAAEHETFPGPGPLRADEAKRGIHPVEQMVDAAIDRIAREQEAARDEGARNGSVQHALALASTEGASTSLAAAAAAAAASASTGSARRANARLRWKGLDVSDEFRSYADRVARGEDLPPFKGKILAEPDAEFPWDPKAKRREEGRALKRQFGLWSGVALFLGLSVWVLIVQVGKQPDASPRTAESAVSTAVLSNQPVVAPTPVEPKAELTTTAEPQPTALQGQPEAPERAAFEPAAPSAAGSTALASLQEGGKDSVAGSARGAAPALASAAGARPSAPAPSPATSHGTGTPAAAAAGSAVGVFVATRSAGGDAPVPNGSVGAVERTPPSATSAVPGSIGQVAAASGATMAPAASAAAPANPGGTEAAAGAHADPKKETGREASAMGPLLVETPSF